MRRLASLDQLVARFARPAERLRLPPRDAVGALLINDWSAAEPIPDRALALRSGWAIASAEVRGASPGSPVPMSRTPARVVPGEALPRGCDAVLPDEALERHGSFLTATDDPAPGMDTHAMAADIGPGDVVAPAGALLRAHYAEVALTCGAGLLDVVRPSVAIAAGGRHATMLAAALARRGIGVAAAAPLRIDLEGEAPRAPDIAGVALAGAEMVALSGRDDQVTIHCAPVMPAMLAVALVLVPRLLGLPVLSRPTRLGAKITSRVGTSDIALLAVGPDGAVALNSGHATLRAFLAADRLLVSAPESEGAPAGAVVMAEGLV